MKNQQTVSEKSDILRDKYFPLIVGEYLIDSCTKEDCYKVVNENLLKVFPKDQGYQLPPKEKETLLPCINEYTKIHAEYFLIYHKDKAIGWFMGEMEDFETFYMRNTGILPKHQGKGIYSAFLDKFIPYITKLGYQRISSHHVGHNKRIFNLKMNKGFMIVGTENHERWGALVKMVKFLNKEREAYHKKKFG